MKVHPNIITDKKKKSTQMGNMGHNIKYETIQILTENGKNSHDLG